MLTSLTKLELWADGQTPHITDAAVVALALDMKRLQSLEVHVTSATVLPVLGKLTDLRRLGIGPLSAEDQQAALQYLTTLTQLTHLTGIDDANLLQEFWRAVYP